MIDFGLRFRHAMLVAPDQNVKISEPIVIFLHICQNRVAHIREDSGLEAFCFDSFIPGKHLGVGGGPEPRIPQAELRDLFGRQVQFGVVGEFLPVFEAGVVAPVECVPVSPVMSFESLVIEAGNGFKLFMRIGLRWSAQYHSIVESNCSKCQLFSPFKLSKPVPRSQVMDPVLAYDHCASIRGPRTRDNRVEDERVVKTVQFSARTNWNTEESALAQAYRERKNSGKNVIDLTASNPTLCGFEYPEKILAPLSDTASLNYDPNPKGSLSAREAVSRYYADAGALINPDSILLTTSTSEAYGYLFKLLCDFDNEVLVPQPSYPLFDFLADAEGVKIVATPLVFDHGWQIDFETLRRRINGRTRAIVLVHPNNPTGHFVQAWESRELERLCREHNLALIVDEVFLDYAFGSATASDRCSFAARGLNCLVFIVSGMSKIAGLPQVKSAWLAALGPGSEHALERLEVLADNLLVSKLSRSICIAEVDRDPTTGAATDTREDAAQSVGAGPDLR